jgi:hypothetical protein
MKDAVSVQKDAMIETILSRIADHMTHLAETLALTETAVAKHFEEALAQDVDAFQDVQNLDYLHQSMTDTAALLNSLSLGHRTQIALVDELKLETTRALVRGEMPDKNQCDRGAIELF